MKDCTIFWGETHDNSIVAMREPVPAIEAVVKATSHLDFYAAAYYTAFWPGIADGGHPSEGKQPARIILEGWKDQKRLSKEWADVQDATCKMNQPGTFVTFPGYEWQGDGSSGDHNVVYLREGLPIHRVNTIAELYTRLRGHDAIAVPHHIAYRAGVRGRDWSVFDEQLSPFAEIYSIHGCSETDEEWVGLRQNSHMGPGLSGGTYQDALDRGLHVGAICSTDNWGDMPGHYGRGLMACVARELTREGLWEAFKARRVYGVTGDRIRLDFRIGDAVMGEIARLNGSRRIGVKVVGSDALDRIEILRNGRVIATHCHQGTWDMPQPGTRTRFKLRIEAGWGPREGEVSLPDRRWEGEVRVSGGRMLAFEPCWISPGQGRPVLKDERATFEMMSSAKNVSERAQNADVFEFEADAGAQLLVRMNGMEQQGTAQDFARGSREMWFRDECVQMLHEMCGVRPGSPERNDIYHHMAYKVKIHRLIPEAAYTAEFHMEDNEPLRGETEYRVRVEQRNAQRAWSSPIWVRPGW